MDSLLGAKEIAQFGAVGIAIALIVVFYFWYKAQEKMMAKKDKAYQDLTSEIMESSRENSEKLVEVIRQNTESSVQLTTAVQGVTSALERNSNILDRIEKKILVNEAKKEKEEEKK